MDFVDSGSEKAKKGPPFGDPYSSKKMKETNYIFSFESGKQFLR
jgi:hypothetical protein